MAEIVNIHPILYQNTRIADGGMFRCCLESIVDFIKGHSQEQAEAGKVIECRLCRESIGLDAEFCWRWNPKPSAGQEAGPS